MHKGLGNMIKIGYRSKEIPLKGRTFKKKRQ